MSARRPRPDLIEHIGWDLFRAARAWKMRFTQAMVEKGFAWYAEARGTLIQHIGHDGIAQSELAQRAGMTKQAVQQHLDDLVEDGILERVVDSGDARRKLVRFTDRGFEALDIANEIKRGIEDDYLRAIGRSDMRTLRAALRVIIDADCKGP